MLILYTKTGCPFCARVLSHVVERGISLEERDIGNEENLAELMEKGGKRQVPFLVDTDTGISMYESGDIIKYLVSRI